MSIESLVDNFFKLQHILTNLVYAKLKTEFLSAADPVTSANTFSFSLSTATEDVRALSSIQLGLAMSCAEFVNNCVIFYCYRLSNLWFQSNGCFR